MIALILERQHAPELAAVRWLTAELSADAAAARTGAEVRRASSAPARAVIPPAQRPLAL